MDLLVKDIIKGIPNDFIITIQDINSESILYAGTVVDIPEYLMNSVFYKMEYSLNGEDLLYMDVIPFNKDKEYYFRVVNEGGEYTSGYMKMTLNQAEFVNKISNVTNWSEPIIGIKYGCTVVDTSDFIPVEAFEDE